MKILKVSEYIARFLKEKGIDTVYELQGGMITRIIDAIHHEGGIKIVSMHHEQAAAMAADAYGRILNKPGIAMATSGPGATNLLTGIGNCYFDSVPAIFITGQVNVNEQKGDRPTRQVGFQETDIVSMAKPVTKKSYAILSAIEVPVVFEEAYQISISGRPGPVLIDIPMNVQNEEIEIPEPDASSPLLLNHVKSLHQAFFREYLEALKASRRPLILVGRGVRASGSVELFRDFVNKFRIPTVTSLLGLDALPYSHPVRIGFIGTYGNRWANYALGTCDLLLVLGSRLDLRQTGSDVLSFQQGKAIYHIDVDEAELNNRVTNCRVLKAGLSEFFDHIEEISPEYEAPVAWMNEITQKKQSRPDTGELENIKGINPNSFIHRLSQTSSHVPVFTSDVGNNQMWASQSLELGDEQLFLTAGGMGAMGYALPAAIGATLAYDHAPVVCITGDGGLQINIQEFQTIVRNKLPLKIVVLNNHCLGMIRQFQDAYFNSCYQSTVWGYDAPDFVKVANAYGIDACSISSPSEIDSGLVRMWEDPSRPFLLNVNIDVHTNVYPKMMFGSPITRMEPTGE